MRCAVRPRGDGGASAASTFSASQWLMPASTTTMIVRARAAARSRRHDAVVTAGTRPRKTGRSSASPQARAASGSGSVLGVFADRAPPNTPTQPSPSRGVGSKAHLPRSRMKGMKRPLGLRASPLREGRVGIHPHPDADAWPACAFAAIALGRRIVAPRRSPPWPLLVC